MIYTVGTAARATGRHKSTISRDIKSGRISATRNPDGSYSIEAAELFRVYPATVSGNAPRDDQQPADATAATELAATRARLEEREREREQLLDSIRDLRGRLDQEAEERRRLTLLLTDQTQKPRLRWWSRWWRQ